MTAFPPGQLLSITTAMPAQTDYSHELTEHLKCGKSFPYFVHTFCMVEDKSADVRDWIPFQLWPTQYNVAKDLTTFSLLSILKARQLGLSWLLIAYALWLMLFRPGSQILMFSRRDDEAQELLERLKGMHEHLPDFLQASVGADNEHELTFPILNSTAKSFPTTKNSGRSYTATLVIIDEADFIQWLKQLITAVKPTIDAGGQLVMISTANKDKPKSEFKRIWRAGRAKLNRYKAIFLPWFARPSRTQQWYDDQKKDYVQDDLWQEYPANPQEALSHRASNMRFSPTWLTKSFAPLTPVDPDTAKAPAIPGLIIYKTPDYVRHTYLIAIDTSEGDPTSDPSPATVFCVETWEEVAHIYGRFEPASLAGYCVKLAQYYNNAVIVPERNNHGHALILAANDLIISLEHLYGNGRPRMYVSPFDGKYGWLSNLKYKTLAMDNMAEALRDGSVTLHTEATVTELGIIEASTNKAVEGETDDRALSAIIGVAALRWPMPDAGGSFSQPY